MSVDSRFQRYCVQLNAVPFEVARVHTSKTLLRSWKSHTLIRFIDLQVAANVLELHRHGACMHCQNVMFARQMDTSCCEVARKCLGWMISFGAASCLKVFKVSCANEGRDRHATRLRFGSRSTVCPLRTSIWRKRVADQARKAVSVTRAEVTHHII